MLSCPPATTQSASPALMACAASITAFKPEPQTLFTVSAPTRGSMPALICAWRAGAWPWPPCTTWPMMTSSTCVPVTFARFMASRMAAAPRSDALSVERPPRNLPMGVRAAATMKASGVLDIGMPLEKGTARARRTRAGRGLRWREPSVPKRADTTRTGAGRHPRRPRAARGPSTSAGHPHVTFLPLLDQLHAGPLGEPAAERGGQVRVTAGAREHLLAVLAAHDERPARVVIAA